MSRNLGLLKRRARRNRYKIRSVSQGNGRLRLSIFRSSKHIYAQIIDDSKGVTLVSASSLEKKDGLSDCRGWNCEGASVVGATLAKRACAQGLTNVFFDRGSCAYHGRLRSFAEAARQHGLQF